MSVRRHVWVKMHRIEALTQQKGLCAYCQEPLRQSSATADHVLAISRGGSRTSKENIKACCRPCNVAKGSLNVKQFQRLLNDPSSSNDLKIHLASMRFRLWRRTHQACRRINRYVGMQ
jgi:5-methylcytosine-specific restriction endonuclease McrA